MPESVMEIFCNVETNVKLTVETHVKFTVEKNNQVSDSLASAS